MNKRIDQILKKNEKIYEELAERRAIESLRMTKDEVDRCKEFECIKTSELISIRDQVAPREEITLFSAFFKNF